jgi:16S rRNA (adenine1518-N6/adenine1519-N6)-dimethyltransferase
MTNSELASASATIAVLSRHGLYTKKSLGQHLLVDDNVVGRIMALAEVDADDVVLEVGPGIGTLTVALCRAAAAVIAVEADRSLPAVLAETTADCEPPPALVLADAVVVDPAELVTAAGAPPDLLVANLPYGVAATVVLRFLEIIPTLRAATVMVQAEVADRMAAVPGTKSYGAYTVKLGLLATAAGRFKVSRGSFLPPPRVDSSVVRLERTMRSGVSPGELVRAARTADAAFCQRRKTLRNSLAAGLGSPAATIEHTLASAGFDPAVRAETLSVEEYIRLSTVLHAEGLV